MTTAIEPWEFCPVPGCEFCVNLWAGEGLCSIHTEQKIGPEEIWHRYRATRDEQGGWTGIPYRERKP